MSLFKQILNGIMGETKSSVSDRPCANCPSDCAVAGDACSSCSPYKKRLIDQIYLIDHIDEYYSRYEVTGITGETVTNCPYCGGRSGNPFVCEYCGSKLSEDSGKIRVEKASDIPNPIMEAQDIIFERADLIAKYASGASSGSGDGLLDTLVSFLKDPSDTDTQNPLGAKMSEAEIREAASLYGVSVSDYLTGLDNGKYLTLAGKKAESTSSSSAYTGIPGVAGIGLLAGAMLGNSGLGYRPVPERERIGAGHGTRPPVREEGHAGRPRMDQRAGRPQGQGPRGGRMGGPGGRK